MEAIDRQAPLARNEGLVVQELPDEVLVYDLDRHRAHSLNRIAAMVWRHCDGKTSVAEMATLMNQDLGLPPDEELVWLALERLGRARLLRGRLTPPAKAPSPSRRALMRSLALAGGLSLVTSIIAPEAHAAGSACTKSVGGVCNCCCSDTKTCQNNINKCGKGGTCL